MLPSTVKLLFFAIALVYVAARPEFEFPETDADELDVEIPKSEADEMDNVEMDSKSIEKKPIVPFPIFKPKCPFDCGKVCVVKYPFTWGIPPQANYFYICLLKIHECCKNACASYQKCVLFGKPEWACYADTLDYICKCRSIVKPKFEIKEVKSKE